MCQGFRIWDCASGHPRAGYGRLPDHVTNHVTTEHSRMWLIKEPDSTLCRVFPRSILISCMMHVELACLALCPITSIHASRPRCCRAHGQVRQSHRFVVCTHKLTQVSADIGRYVYLRILRSLTLNPKQNKISCRGSVVSRLACYRMLACTSEL